MVYILKILKYVTKKYFQIVLLVSKLLLNFFLQLLSSGYKSLKVFIPTHYRNSCKILCASKPKTDNQQNSIVFEYICTN